MENNENLSSFPIVFPEKINRHNRSKPPKDAYLFFPREDELIDYDEKNPKATRRKIFERKREDNLLEYEKSRLDAFYKEAGEDFVYPKNWKETDTLKFLQSTSFDNSKTINIIKDHIEWRTTFYPLKINYKISEILNSGFIYIHGRDNHYRPIVVINAKQYLILKEKNYSLEDISGAIIYFIEYILNFMLIPGQVENWNIIADLSDIKVYYLPAELMKIFKILQSNYRARMNVNYIVGMSPFLNAVWTLVKKLIDSQTNKKIRFLKPEQLGEIFEFTNKEQVEEKYGGTAKNILPEGDLEQNGYFPPSMPSDNYLKPTDRRDEMLISEEKYRDLFSQGKLTVVSPFFLEKINCRNSISKFDSESVYEDAKSFIPFGQNENNSQLDVSLYENCKEINANSLNKSYHTQLETEGDFVIDHEFSGNNKKGNIQYITPNQSMKDLLVIEAIRKKEIDFCNNNFNSNYNTGVNEEQIEKVKATSIFTPKKITNSTENGSNSNGLSKGSSINQTPNRNSPTKRNSPLTNNETIPTANNYKNDCQHFTLNEEHDDYEKKVTFEKGIKQQCCSSKGKCLIF